MADIITSEIIDHVSALAQLELSPAEREAAKKDMNRMLAYADQLQELDVAEVEPMTHVIPLDNVFREDIVTNENNGEEMLLNAPKQEQGQYQVPKTID